MTTNTQGGLPLYRQIASDLWEQIQRGERRPGEQMPNEAALCAHYGVNRLTLRQAIIELQRLGAVEIRRGTGTFIATPPDLVEIIATVPQRRQHSDSTLDSLAQQSDGAGSAEPSPGAVVNPLPTAPLRQVDERVEFFGPATGAAADQAAEHLGLPAENLLRLDTVMSREGSPWIANSYWFSRDYEALPEYHAEHGLVVTAFQSGFGLDLVYRWRAFSAAAANYDEARQLNVQAGSALLVRDGVTGSTTGDTVFYVRRRLRGEDAKFVLKYEDPEED